MGTSISIIYVIFLIIGLTIIYLKSDKSEDFLIIKLVSCYLLGSFKFNLNNLAIPLGFIICLIFLRPKLNTRGKWHASLLGFLFFVIALSIPSVDKYLYERHKEVSAHSVSINTIDFEKDWKLIKERLDINTDTRLEGFEVSYEKDGTIRSLGYQLISRTEGALSHYSVRLFPEKEKYIIEPRKIMLWLQYDRLVTAERFFQVIPLINIEEITPRGIYEYYCISSRGELINYKMEENEKYIITSKDNIVKIRNDELPIEGYYFSAYGMRKKSETASMISYEGEGNIDYIFDVSKE